MYLQKCHIINKTCPDSLIGELKRPEYLIKLTIWVIKTTMSSYEI